MSIIKELQEDLLIQHEIAVYNRGETDLLLTKLQAMITHIKVSDLLGKPLFPGYTFEKLAVESDEEPKRPLFALHNDNITGLRNDTDVVDGTIDWIQTTIDKADKASEKIFTFIKDIGDKLNALIRRASTRLRAAAKTLTIDFSSAQHIDTTNTTALIDLENHVCSLAAKSNVGQVNIRDLDKSDVTISFDNNVPYGTDKLPYLILRPASDDIVNITAIDYSNSLNEIGGSIQMRLNKDGYNKTINSITIEMANPDAVTLRAEAIYGTGDQKEIVPEFLAATGIYTFTFEGIDASTIELFMHKVGPDLILDNERRFTFSIKRILLENTAFQSEGIVQSTAISAGMSVGDVMLKVDHYVPRGADVDYFVSSDGTRWIGIDPINEKESPRNVISLGLKSTISIDDITENDSSRWSTLQPLEDYGNKPLYNIIEKAGLSDFVSGDVLDISGSAEVSADLPSIRLMRGYDTYAIDNSILEIKTEIENVKYVFTDVATGGVESLEIYTRIDNEAKVIKSDLTIELQYIPANDDIYVTDGVYKLDIISRNGKTLLLSGPSGAQINTTTYVTYPVLIRTLEQSGKFVLEVDPDSFEMRHSPDEETIPDGNFFVDPIGRLVSLSENTEIGTSVGEGTTQAITVNVGSGSSSSTMPRRAKRTAYVSFSYTTKSREKYNIYTTNVFYSVETEIVIYPFTEEEIQAGNLHVIDGINVSNMTTYLMKSGWHNVRTTQPYKTDPNNRLDVNQLTSDVSIAGINLGEYEEMRAFEKPLRLVSTKALSNQVGPKDHRSFAYSGVKILLNYVPESLPEQINIYESHVKGIDIIGKRAIYTADGDFDYYEIIPDKYSLFLNTKRKEEDSEAVTQIYVKANLTREGKKTYQTPILNRIELLLL